MSSSASKPGDLVCVTGASGFIGCHIVRELLERGYRVRGTVRNAADEDATAPLRKLAEDLGGELELVSADLTVSGAFDEALDSVEFVVHAASSVRLKADDPQRDIVDVAVGGTKEVFSSIEKAGCAKRVVLTSSIAAVIDDDRPVTHTFVEDDWNETATVEASPYPLSKTLAEREAWKRTEAAADTLGFDLITINPSLVLGPVYGRKHLRTSPSIIRDLLTGKFPMVPGFTLGIVDVREVATAHVEALEREDAQGRHILSNRAAPLMDVAKILRGAYPSRKIPKRRMPDFGMYVVALFDSRMTWAFLRKNLGIVRKLDNARSQDRLGVKYRSLEETILDTAKAMDELGLLEPRSSR